VVVDRLLFDDPLQVPAQKRKPLELVTIGANVVVSHSGIVRLVHTLGTALERFGATGTSPAMAVRCCFIGSVSEEPADFELPSVEPDEWADRFVGSEDDRLVVDATQRVLGHLDMTCLLRWTGRRARWGFRT
jgi:hypothetical protein